MVLFLIGRTVLVFKLLYDRGMNNILGSKRVSEGCAQVFCLALSEVAS